MAKSSSYSAGEALSILKNRYSKKKKITRPCGDVLPYRYLPNQQYDLRHDVISIVTFAHLARYLTKTQIESIAGHKSSLKRAKQLLEEEKHFPFDWWDCYVKWTKMNRKLALCFFTGMFSRLPHGTDNQLIIVLQR